LRLHLIRLFKKIVDKYTIKRPETNVSNVQQLQNDYEELSRENDMLKDKLESLLGRKEAKSRPEVASPERPQPSISPSFKNLQGNTVQAAPRPQHSSKDKKVKSTQQVSSQNTQNNLSSTLKQKQEIHSDAVLASKLLPWANNKDLGQGLKDINYKTMTYKVFKELIDEIFEAKIVHDRKCEESRQPRLTLEQFLYFHLKQKYGLNSLVIEWVFAIVDGVRLHSEKDIEVALFGLVGLLDPQERNRRRIQRTPENNGPKSQGDTHRPD
jgi:hypothetical protein